MNILEKLVPEQKEGWKTNTEETVEAGSPDEAKTLYYESRRKLLDVNRWDHLNDMPATFSLTNEKGDPHEGPVKEGNYFKIKMPAPSTDSGDGYDWVRVEAVAEVVSKQENSELTFIIVHPASNPTAAEQAASHFFSEEASSCFTVYREGNKVTAAVYGRNEKPNTGSENVVDKARNVIVALGAALGMSKVQWKSLVKGLVNTA